ncbi:hypothetical protein D9Q98_003192 [Chlorella vulgaris]|uniref:F-box domain-containing protein n=1 Tax=Chlorella vulgaris TaxID=3077 RepID=A0A9D4TTH5_CHLVU|nr:hypothetical protein D9Q98_003192 [Chlorella vulgaris]
MVASEPERAEAGTAQSEPCEATPGRQQHDTGHAASCKVTPEASSEAQLAVVRCRKHPHPATVGGGARHRGGTHSCQALALGRSDKGVTTLCAIAIHELDENAIELIFTFLPVEDRRSAAAVCRLWRRVHNSSTKLWGSVLLSGERIMQAAASSSAGAIVSWLGARLEAMRSVRLWSPYLPLEAFATGLAQLLSRENRLQSFSYVCTDGSVSRLLGELQGLTSLQLLDILSPAFAPGQGLVMRARELALLKPLSNLLSLQLHAREIRGSLPPALFRCLHRLQHLAISAKCRLPAAVVRQLAGLQSLELHGASMDQAAAEAAACLQQLTRLAISVNSHHHLQQDGGQRDAAAVGSDGSRRRGSSGGSKGSGSDAVQCWQDHAIWGHLPQLARLQQLWVGAELPCGGGGGDEMQGGATLLPYDVLEGGVPDGIMDCAALTHLVLPVALTALPELVPGQLAQLASLDLTHSILEGLPASWCRQLAQLRSLVLNGAPLAGGQLPPDFAALRGLQHLELRACRLTALPACVARLPALTHLDLGLNRLPDLPAGPYLRCMRHLVLRGNELQALPAALAQAEQLECLDVGENEDLVLQVSDVDGLLAKMPNLGLLVISRQPAGHGFGPYISTDSGAAWDVQSVGVLMQLARVMPHLSVQLQREAPPGQHSSTAGSQPS